MVDHGWDSIAQRRYSLADCYNPAMTDSAPTVANNAADSQCVEAFLNARDGEQDVRERQARRNF